ncbi:TonB-dependent receptor [Pseudomonas aestusnigri]|jgi:outer membrane receptor for ferrienterochelin and colicins|uniref:TonB-dependent receptor domain-containing protein n=1 Tax=Halopseudomonas aestusnigri TaxID=857252 RepID=UPI001D18343B|nr:TonB-dependent receptor [Halopseudomonas aestusnigri]MCC4260361.1 TonB-dependent receptor [Halopseudomonas aestusnigri]
MFPFRRRSLLASAVALVASTPSLQADEVVTLDNLVVTASGFEQKLTNAPASISVISQQDLQQKRYNSLAHALGDVEGIDIGQGTGKTGGLNISIRGMPSEYTLILIDGRRQNAAGNVTPNGFNETSTSFIPPLSAIERIEVIRGPMSTLYGSDAMGGVINIITRKVADEWTGSLTLDHTLQENSDYGATSNASVYASGPLVEDLLGLQLRASAFKRQESDLTFGNGSEVSKRGPSPVDGNNRNLGARLTLTPHENHDFSLDLEQGRQRYNNDECQLGTLDGLNRSCTAASDTANGYADELRFEREQIALTHTARLGIGTLDSSITHSTTETIGRTLPGSPIGSPSGIPGSLAGDDRELETTNLIFDSKLVTPIGDNHITTVGAQWWEAEMTDGIALEDFEQKTWAVFAEDEWQLRDDLALTLGARYDDHDAFGGHISPRAYLVWNATDSWTLKGGVSRGYRTPDLNDLHDGVNGISGQGTVVTIGNPELEPETTTSTEVGVYYDSYDGISANATVFHNTFEDKIANGNPVSDPLCAGNAGGTCSQLVNIDEAVTRGLELAARWEVAPAWTLSGNYTYTDSEQKSGADKGQPLTNTPQHLANAKLNWQASARIDLWLRGEYRGERARFSSSYANLANANGSYSSNQALYDALGKNTKAYTLFHLGGSLQATENLTFNATIYNLFDKDFLKGQTYTTYTSSGAVDGSAFGSDYIVSGRSTTGVLEEGRRLWLSANLTF